MIQLSGDFQKVEIKQLHQNDLLVIIQWSGVFFQKVDNWQRHNNDQEDVTECQYQVRMRRIQTYYWSCHVFFGI